MLRSRRFALLLALGLASTAACKGRTVANAEGREGSLAGDGGEATRATPDRDPPLPGQTEGNFVVRNFHFASGETLAELRIHYTTLGAPHRDARGVVDNAALFLHGTTGRGESFLSPTFREPMFGAGRPFDASKFYVILPDDVGHGGSSKPSDGLRARFPHYGYKDMVALEHRLVVDGLGVGHLHAVVGTSMGGMHAWMWSEQYADFMDAAIPIAATPTALSGRNLLWRRIIVEATKTDPDYDGGDYSRPPHGFLATLPLFQMMVDGPDHLFEAAPDVPGATALIAKWTANGHPELDANDAIYALDASRDYDPEPDLDAIRAPVLAINFADDQIVGPSLERSQRAFARVRRVEQIVVPKSAASRGHATLGLPSEWMRPVVEFLGRLK